MYKEYKKKKKVDKKIYWIKNNFKKKMVKKLIYKTKIKLNKIKLILNNKIVEIIDNKC